MTIQIAVVAEELAGVACEREKRPEKEEIRHTAHISQENTLPKPTTSIKIHMYTVGLHAPHTICRKWIALV